MSRYFLTFCAWAPPTIGGTPTVMRNLFHELPPESFHVFRRHVEPQSTEQPPMPTSTFLLPKWLRSIRGSHYLLIPWLVWAALKRVQSDRVPGLLVVIPEASFALAAWIVSRLTGIPIYLYFHDTYQEQQVHPLDKVLAKWFEPELFRHATKIFVISEGLQELYRSKYGIETAVVPHCHDSSERHQIDDVMLDPGLFHFVFTGDVYDMNLDAMRNLVRVIEAHPDPRIRLTISTRSERKYLEEQGITGARLRTVFLPTRDHVYALQRQADVLFLPMAFESPYPVEVATGFPTKTIEYLATARPILVHCPRDSFVAKFTRKFQLGALVDANEVDDLRAAVDGLMYDPDLRQEYVRRAKGALDYFNATRIAGDFQRALGETNATAS